MSVTNFLGTSGSTPRIYFLPGRDDVTSFTPSGSGVGKRDSIGFAFASPGCS